MKELLRCTFHRFGIDVHRYSRATDYDYQFGAMLAHHRINLIFDIGANTGQFSAELRRRIGYQGRIVSFEPLRSAHAELVRVSADDPLWEVAPRTAIGASSGVTTLNVSGNSQSSSVLPMLQSHALAAPDSAYVGEEEVSMTTLDAACEAYPRKDSRIFLKIDTQGYESEVLRGAPGMLARSCGVQLEMSLAPLYEGQKLFLDLWQTMDRAGYELWNLLPVFGDQKSGRLLQVDATFFRKVPAV